MRKILILGSSGMLGSSLFRNLSEDYEIIGIQRSESSDSRIIDGVDVSDFSNVAHKITEVMPDVVINCIGVVKQKSEINNVLNTVPINTLLPHQLAELTEEISARLIHFSTDCIFDGKDGMYKDNEMLSAKDIYGVSKYFGEVGDKKHVLTIRTSIIGHGVKPNSSLVDWFLAQEGTVKGFSNAYFSGLPCSEISEILDKWIIPNETIYGIYNISVDKIDKYSLLKIIKKIYKKKIKIVIDDGFKIDRSLNSERFRAKTGYRSKTWTQLVEEMKIKDFGVSNVQQ